MNKRAYLRGIGAGMIVAAIVMGVSTKSTMTDDEILRRAKEIEAAESTVLTQISVSSDGIVKEIPTKETETVSTSVDSETSVSFESDTQTVAADSDAKEDDNQTETSTETSDEETPTSTETPSDDIKEETGASVEQPSENEVKEPEKIDPLPEGETGYTNNEGSVQIQIVRGDSSVSVSRRMYEAGLVESAVEFDRYLCTNGYDKSISVGTYDIAYGLEFEDMAKIISRRR